MANLLRKLHISFLPQDSNDHHPFFFRKKALLSSGVVLLIVALAILAASSFAYKKEYNKAEVLPALLVSYTNEYRVGQNLPALTRNPVLDQAAELKAKDMIEKGYFAHVSPSGVNPWYWLTSVGYPYASAGENLAIGFNDSKDVVVAWMNSESHRKNILKQKYTEIGMAVAEGQIDGRNKIFVVQYFGLPKSGAVGAVNGGVVTNPNPAQVSNAADSVSEAVRERILSPHNTIESILIGLIVLLIIFMLLSRTYAKVKYKRGLRPAYAITLVIVFIFLGILVIMNRIIFQSDAQIAQNTAAIDESFIEIEDVNQ